jgi:hypothetical protein
MAGQVTATADTDRGRELLVEAADEIEKLGVTHLSQRARELAA